MPLVVIDERQFFPDVLLDLVKLLFLMN